MTEAMAGVADLQAALTAYIEGYSEGVCKEFNIFRELVELFTRATRKTD